MRSRDIGDRVVREARHRRFPLAVVLAVLSGWAVLAGSPGTFAADRGHTEFVGIVEALPADGLLGDWVVSGRTVHVSARTRIVDRQQGVAVGFKVEIDGMAEADGSLSAMTIKVQEEQETPDEVAFVGVVESLPADGLIGDWVVAGVTVHVGAETEIDEDGGPPVVGSKVKVEGVVEADGSVTAIKIKVLEEETEGEIELVGLVESLPADGLVGDWVVAGVTVHVGEGTAIEDGPPLVGSKVKVEGVVEADGSITARSIEVIREGPEGPGHHVASDFGVLHLVRTEAAPEEAEGVVVVKVFTYEGGSVAEDLKVGVEGLTPDATHDVMVDGVHAGTIVANAEGEGSLFLSSREVPGAEPLPAELRPLLERQVVEVLDGEATVLLTGNFADAKWHHHDHPETESAYVAVLVNGDGDTVGAAVADDKGAEQRIDVYAAALPPNASLKIVIDAQLLGDVVTDPRGRLRAIFTTEPDGQEMPLPPEFVPVTALLLIELRAEDDTVLASGEFQQVAKPGSSPGHSSPRRHLGH